MAGSSFFIGAKNGKYRNEYPVSDLDTRGCRSSEPTGMDTRYGFLSVMMARRLRPQHLF